MKVVIKVGGSLMKTPNQLRLILKAISELAEPHNILVVPGGGALADVVRVIHTGRNLSDSAAHWLAIRCMDLNGTIMAEMQSSLNLYSGTDVLEKWAEGQSFIIQPYELLKFHDRLPHSWHVTSDSIALWIGIQAEADVVILVKSVSPYRKWWSVAQSEAEAVKPESFQFLVDKEIIDRYMVQLRPKFKGDLYVVNGLWVENLLAVFSEHAQ